ncbi:hypothetical protein SADUNF_Sadunf10G0139200 [Salix dunnii]|uniref:Ataxin-2 C-terminal domain-containing protein n=1 Tax=Salix dunnii TaxID=1413687 RepID=A0A835MR33_9ROSI|nr:hypothetical protein SADUNF_Sadunf10G0139200 [Salix dunnii]
MDVISHVSTSTLNPNAPLFVPLSYRTVEDFSDQWWALVHSSPWFRDYWLQECFYDPVTETLFSDTCDPFLPEDLDSLFFDDPIFDTIKVLKWKGDQFDRALAPRYREKVPKVVNVKLSPRTIQQPRQSCMTRSNSSYQARIFGALLMALILPFHLPSSDNPESSTPSLVNPDYVSWFQIDQCPNSIVHATLSESILPQVIGFSTSKKILDCLKQDFSQKFVANFVKIKFRLFYITKSSKSTCEYLAHAKSLANELTVIQESVSNSDLVTYVLRGLGFDYQMILTAILNFSPLPPFPDLELASLLLKGIKP